MYIMTSEPISTAYVINPSHQSVCLYVYPSCRRKATARLNISLHSVLGNGSVNKIPRQQTHARIIKGGSVGLSVYPLPLLGSNEVKRSRSNEELLEASFSMRSVSYHREVGDYFFPKLLVYCCFPNPLFINFAYLELCL
jgi:hypothetical protein